MHTGMYLSIHKLCKEHDQFGNINIVVVVDGFWSMVENKIHFA